MFVPCHTTTLRNIVISNISLKSLERGKREREREKERETEREREREGGRDRGREGGREREERHK